MSHVIDVYKYAVLTLLQIVCLLGIYRIEQGDTGRSGTALVQNSIMEHMASQGYTTHYLLSPSCHTCMAV
jgi:hypothetical protein